MLVVEDEAVIAFDLQLTLEDAGASVPDIAVSNAEACRAMRDASGRVDAVLLDFRLTDGEAHEAARCAAGLGLPVVFHSGHMLENELIQRYPGSVFLRKPSSAQQIVAAIARQIACGAAPA